MLLILVMVIYQFENLRADSHQVLSEELLNQKKDKYKLLVQTRAELLAQLYQQNGGDIFKEDIESIFARFNEESNLEDNYFFIYDLDGKTVSLPPTPHLEGTNRWDLEVEGRNLLQEMSKLAHNGGGEIEYPYTNPVTGEIEMKFGYIEPIRDTDYFIGSGGYESSFYTILDKIKLKIVEIRRGIIYSILVLFFIISTIMMIIIIDISNYIKKNINVIIEGFKEVGRGNIEFKLKNKSNDEFQQLFSGFNNMLKQINYLTYNDSLTGLPNIKFLHNRFKADYESCKCFKYIFTLGLNNFDIINSNYGYKVGNELLKKVSDRLIDILDEDILIARNDIEFIFYYKTELKEEDILIFGNKVLEKLRVPYDIDNNHIYLEPQLGISYTKRSDISFDELINKSKVALHFVYADKNDLLIHKAYMEGKLSDRVDLESKMRQAMKREEFLLYYQPIINIKTNKVVGLEALIRWESPGYGLISPGKFIPVAESTGLIISLGSWVLEKSCEKLKSLEEKGYSDMFISVNISPKEFQHPDFLEKVELITEETGIDPNNLKLEMTERTTIEDVEYTIEMLNKLRSLGLKIAIDDFGTGYSSLAYLNKFSIDTLKIDKSFIQSKDNQEIVKVIIMMSNNLNLEVIAEGVETEEQLEFLLENQCSMSQGYLFAKPMGEEEVVEFLEDHN
ncbi:EAL domain-containing protein [Halonatronum saccharophilum]|uniref:EAL domain-containing protein n=1 Tax=Halonatronum saccharophilum TaxID=150060 RepID=UPI001FE24175|nr:EAL domain-containing protein [Halonatronum saccharophilum]